VQALMQSDGEVDPADFVFDLIEGQSLHCVLALLEAYFPTGQLAHTDEPLSENFPGGQVKHDKVPPANEEFDIVPALQLKQGCLPSEEYDPDRHLSRSV
jgi:hypothetical protein